MGANLRSETVLDFWFGPILPDAQVSGRRPTGGLADTFSKEKAARWWRKDPAFDELIRRDFSSDMERAARGELDSWKDTARGRLALIILLDQFSRNAYRDTPAAFANDARALSIAQEGIELGHDRALRGAERAFSYMPLVHAEDAAAQERGVEAFARAKEELGESFGVYLEFAKRHRDIVLRFGRFPHRNAILGRESTPEEIEFLKQPGSSF